MQLRDSEVQTDDVDDSGAADKKGDEEELQKKEKKKNLGDGVAVVEESKKE